MGRYPPDPPTERANRMRQLTARQRQILEFIAEFMRDRGFPPSVREIAEAVGLSSTATVHNHLAALAQKGYLRRDTTKPRALELSFEPQSGAKIRRRPVQNVPLVGDVAAGTGVLAVENVEEFHPLPADFVGDGDLFMVRVRGDSMIDAGILSGDYVVVRAQTTADNGDVVVAGIGNEEGTVKEFMRKGDRVVLRPHNTEMTDLVYPADQVTVFGKVVTVLRRL